MSKRLVAVSGALLAAVTIAGTATAYADEPNPQPQPEAVAAPVDSEAMQDVQAEQQRVQAEQQADQMAQTASTAGATQSSAMATQMGSQMAMMAPMMGMMAPMMVAPMMLSGVNGLIPAEATEAGVGIAAATEPFAAAPVDIPLDVDITPFLDGTAELPGMAADIGADIGAEVGATVGTEVPCGVVGAIFGFGC